MHADLQLHLSPTAVVALSPGSVPGFQCTLKKVVESEDQDYFCQLMCKLNNNVCASCVSEALWCIVCLSKHLNGCALRNTHYTGYI